MSINIHRVEKDGKTTVTKILEENILIKRYYSSGQLKFESYLGYPNEMPDELRDKENGTEITVNKYVTKRGRNGITSWWFENGQKAREGTWKNNKEEGKLTIWYENGQKHSERIFKDGEVIGEILKWSKDGQMPKAAKTTIVKISDEKILIKRYWSNGQLKFEGTYKEMPYELLDKADGTRITPNDYETKGKNKDGLCVWWFENGQIRSEKHYKDGKLDGKWTLWYENGQIKAKEHYKDGKKDDKETWWFENGQIKAEGNSKDGKPDGKFTYWDDNGQKHSERIFKDGEVMRSISNAKSC